MKVFFIVAICFGLALLASRLDQTEKHRRHVSSIETPL